jgi:hypothetical protein
MKKLVRNKGTTRTSQQKFSRVLSKKHVFFGSREKNFQNVKIKQMGNIQWFEEHL